MALGAVTCDGCGPSALRPPVDQLGPCINPRRLHYALLAHILDLNPTGVGVEFGVGAGNSTRMIAERMPVIGFDSGAGLPEDWRPDFKAGSFACPLPTIPNATLIEGWFTDTIPEFDFSKVEVGLVHIDCDLYSSTKTALEHVGPHLKAGAYVVFDEAHSYPGWDRHEWRAWHEFACDSGLRWDVVGHGFEQWGIRIA